MYKSYFERYNDRVNQKVNERRINLGVLNECLGKLTDVGIDLGGEDEEQLASIRYDLDELITRLEKG